MSFVTWHAWRLTFRSRTWWMIKLYIIHKVYAELNLVLQLSVESETLHKHGQTLSQTAADFQSCAKPSLLSFSICGMHLENYKWEKKASISNILWLYWQYPVGAPFWQTAFWLMLKICTNSLILFLFLKREFRLVSKTKVYLHGYKIWSLWYSSVTCELFSIRIWT